MFAGVAEAVEAAPGSTRTRGLHLDIKAEFLVVLSMLMLVVALLCSVLMQAITSDYNIKRTSVRFLVENST